MKIDLFLKKQPSLLLNGEAIWQDLYLRTSMYQMGNQTRQRDYITVCEYSFRTPPLQLGIQEYCRGNYLRLFVNHDRGTGKCEKLS